MALKISVIIPTYNEAQHIAQTVNMVKKRADQLATLELIIVDASSNDGTQDIVQQLDGVLLCDSPARGRAAQMNYGAAQASANILYFLHADTVPPQDFDRHILAFSKPHQQAGCFRMKFDSSHWWLRLAGWGTRFRYKFCRGGDQSLFVTKALFLKAKGFDESFVICEDLNLIDRLWGETYFGVLAPHVTSSARTYFSKGIWNLQYHFWVLQYKYRRGQDPLRLYGYYQKHVQSQ